MIKTFNYKNTNAQIHHMARCQKDTTCGIILKRGLFRDIRNDIPISRTHKYFLREYRPRISSESRTVVQGLVSFLQTLLTVSAPFREPGIDPNLSLSFSQAVPKRTRKVQLH